MRLQVVGGRPLAGAAKVAGSKNAFHKLVAGCIAIPAVHELSQVPRSGDAEALLDLAVSLGAKVDRTPGCVRVDTRSLTLRPLAVADTSKSTGSFLFAGALLGRFGRAEIGPPGGDKVGERPVDRHLDAFRALGATVGRAGASYEIAAAPLSAGVIRFSRDTVNGTANAILAAVGVEGTTVIEHASADPDVSSLVEFLRQCGCSIRRTGGTLVVRGGTETRRTSSFRVPADRNDAVTLVVAAALCGGPVELTGVTTTALEPFVSLARGAGVEVGDVGAEAVRVRAGRLGDAIEVESAPFPGFLTDWGPLIQVLMTQLRGVSVFRERIFSDRFRHLAQLRAMGAAISVSSAADSAEGGGATARIEGPTALSGAEVSGHDLRGVAALLLAGLIARGPTVISGAEHLERGYEDLIPRLRGLGAEISMPAPAPAD